MIVKHARYGVIAIVLIGLQTSVIRLVAIEGITPDILTIFIIYLALSEGQIPATIWGFTVGLLLDLTAADSFLGLSAFSKTICGFISGYFFNENKTKLTLGSYRFLLIVLLVSSIQNIIYFILINQGSNIGIIGSIFQFGITTAIYTAVISFIPVFAFSRRL